MPPTAPFDAAVAWVKAHGCPYTANAGDIALRGAIAAHYAYPGLDRAENVCVTVGSQEALFLAIKACCDPATDEVLVVTPAYPAYAKLAQLEGIHCRTVGLDPARGFAPDPAAVLAAVGPATRLVVIASPSNPTGRVWSDAHWAELALGLAALPGRPVHLLVDEVYRELTFGATYPAAATHYPHVLVANSLSKSHAMTGLRLGWLMAPAEMQPDIVKTHQFVATAASTFSQRVALAVFDEPFEGCVLPYVARRTALMTALNTHALHYVTPDGSFYVMVRLPSRRPDSLAAARDLLEVARVVTVPGVAFGAEGWLRVSWAGDTSTIAKGLERLAAWL